MSDPTSRRWSPVRNRQAAISALMAGSPLAAKLPQGTAGACVSVAVAVADRDHKPKTGPGEKRAQIVTADRTSAGEAVHAARHQ
jgi:negative regulator of sigma E activity